jgi:hypothetical protein
MKRAIRTKGLVLNVILSLIVGYSNAVKTTDHIRLPSIYSKITLTSCILLRANQIKKNWKRIGLGFLMLMQ